MMFQEGYIHSVSDHTYVDRISRGTVRIELGELVKRHR